MDLGKFNQKIKGKELIVWDLDGTLAELDIDWLAMKKELSEHCGPSETTRSLNELVDEMEKNDKGHQAMEIIWKHELGCPYQLNQETINLLSENQHLINALYTDNLASTAMDVLKGHLDKFDLLVTREDVDRPKPSPSGLLIIIEEAGVPPDKILYVGDSWKDKRIAKEYDVDFFEICTY